MRLQSTTWRAGIALALFAMGPLALLATDHPTYPAYGSPFVPLDSWVYPVFDRLASMGYAPTAFAGLRPWTRQECARLISEAGDMLQDSDSENEEAWALHHELEQEFADELSAYRSGRNRAVRLESVYTRFLGISGPPLTDGFHFGQSIVNDFGRPYEEGFNMVAGVSARAVRGRFYAYFRGEYQHAPGAPPRSDEIRQLISEVDQVPILPPQAIPTRNQFRLLDTYVGVNLGNTQLTFGKQSVSWDPGYSGSLNLSENAQPIYMLRITRVMPFVLPSVFRILGPVRTETFFGKLSGFRNPVRPWFFGQKVVLKPTPNLELGLSRTAMFAGDGPSPNTDRPLTARTFFDVIFSFANRANSDPGDRRIGLDLRYRIPRLRQQLMLYLDTMADDDQTVVVNPQNGLYKPGIRIAGIPHLKKLELRLERPLASTRFTTGSNGAPRPNQGDLIYWNGHYRDGYTHNGALLGNWIGRAGQGWWADVKYWISPRNTIQFNYRYAGVHGNFIPEGGTLSQVTGLGRFLLGAETEVTARLQYERWNFPVLDPRPQSNVVASFQLTYWPRSRPKPD